MKVEEFSNTLTREMDTLLQLNEQDTLEEIKILSNGLLQIITRLKDFILHYKFESPQEEINFFKNIKPKFLSKFFLYQKLFEIKSRVPPGLTEEIRAYYYKELQGIKNYIEANSEFFVYCKSGSEIFDEIYFARKRPDLWLSLNGNYEDGIFTTVYDNKLSRLLAYEEVSTFLIGEINELQIRAGSTSGHSDVNVSWTGSKASLIELLYALQTTGVCNNGSIDVKQLALHFEKLFNIKLGNFYRTFQEIRIRKISRTSFLDQMKETLLHRMDECDENPRW